MYYFCRKVYLINNVESLCDRGIILWNTYRRQKVFDPHLLWQLRKYLIFIILWKMIAVYAWTKRKSMCALDECSTGKLLTQWLNSLTRVCLYWTASVTPSCVVLETLIFLQNACWSVNVISPLDSPVCQFPSGCLENTPVAHGCYVPWLKWKSQMCKDQLRK